jgi:hypothetical protein
MELNMRGESPDDQPAPNIWVVAVRYILYYLLWFLISGIALWLVFLVRQNLVEDIFFMRVNPWQLRAIDRWSFFVLGTAWIVAIFLIEGALRKALEKGRFWARAGMILFVQLALIAVSFLIRIL